MLAIITAALETSRLVDREEVLGALRDADISITKAAIWMDNMDRALLERQLNGEGHLSHKRLGMLPISFWRAYAFRMLVKVGPPKDLRRGMAIMLALLAHKRMARMSAQTTRQLRSRKAQSA